MPTGTDGTYHAYRSVIPLPLHGFREMTTGDVSNIAANGGILASDTTPIMLGVGSTISQEISWAASNNDQIGCQVALPADFDGRQDVLVEAWVYSGTTDAASFTVQTSWDGGTAVSTTLTDGAKSATVHRISAVIPAGSIPDAASYVSLTLDPAAHTTNATNLANIRLSYLPRRV
jgi:hypothetical protein